MSGPILPSLKDLLKLPGALVTAGFRKAWLAITGRWRECPGEKGRKCHFAGGGTCGKGPGMECPH